MSAGEATERRAKVHTAGGRSATQQPKHWIQSSLILEKEESGFFFGCFSFDAFLTTYRGNNKNKVAAEVFRAKGQREDNLRDDSTVRREEGKVNGEESVGQSASGHLK